MGLKKLRLSLLVASIAACMFIVSCQTEQKVTGYSSKRSHDPKFMNDITMGDHKHSAVNLDEMIDENEEDDATDQTPVASSNYNYTAPNPTVFVTEVTVLVKV